MKKLLILLTVLASVQQSTAQTDNVWSLDNRIIFKSCVLSIVTSSGTICIKSDGTVDIPKNIEIDKLSREFWSIVAKSQVAVCGYNVEISFPDVGGPPLESKKD